MKILFVCLGNICRSPMAQGVFEGLLEAQNRCDAFYVDSCGTGDWHIGGPPDARARAVVTDRRHRGAELGLSRAVTLSLIAVTLSLFAVITCCYSVPICCYSVPIC